MTAFILAALMLALSCGCAWIGSALEGMDGKGQDKKTEPAATEAATASPTAEPHAVNPVFALLGAFIEEYNSVTNGLLRAAAESGSAELSQQYMALCSSEAEIAVIYGTVGMFEGDGAGWSGSFTGAYSGSGSMNSRGSFGYDFEEGLSILGRVTEGLLYCSIGETPEEIDLDEPTPVPTEEPSSLPTEGQTEQTEEATAEPTEAPSPLPTARTSGGSAGSMLAELQYAETRMAVKRTESGWISAVRKDGRLYVAELCGGRLYFAELITTPAGFDPLDGIAQRADTLGVTILCCSPETGAELIG